jgi:hypothetical protein
MSGFFDFLAEQDPGGEWIIWNPEVAEREPELLEAVEAFESLAIPAGEAAAAWLREESLDNHPSTVTRLLLRDHRVEAFFSLCSGQVKFSQSQRKRLFRKGTGLRPDRELHELHPIQPVALIAWLAKAQGSDVSGGELLLQASATALEVVETVGQGQVAIAIEPFDEETAEFWREEYGFKKSQERDGHWQLWRTIMPNPDRPETPG